MINPIFRRYCRSRLRPRGLGIGLLITVILAGFVFFMARSIGLNRLDFISAADAERLAIFPLLILQGLILFFLGTGQVAGGMTAEADEGVLDYQKLAPMSPLAKVLGYLFGLPVREYVLVFATFPFTAWAFWKGEVELEVGVQLYVVFFSSAILYHLTGLVAGTVVKNRRWAFLISMGVVFLLYTVIPQIAKFGLVYFKYLTMWPVYEELLSRLLPEDLGRVVDVADNFAPTARFFDLNFSEWIFTVFSQGVLIPHCHCHALAALAEDRVASPRKALGCRTVRMVQVLLLGNALPLVESGNIFPSRELNRRFQILGDWEPDGMEAVMMAGVFGLVTLGILWVFTLMITPTEDGQLRGWRRARKLGRNRLAFGSDPATAFWSVLIMSITGIVGTCIFTTSIVESKWFPGHDVPVLAWFAYALTFLTGGMGFHALLESKGGRAIGLAVLLLGIVPIMVGAVIASVSDRWIGASSWFIGMSPASAPIYANAAVLSLADLPREVARSVPSAFWFWQCFFCVATVWLIAGLRKSRKRIREHVEK